MFRARLIGLNPIYQTVYVNFKGQSSTTKVITDGKRSSTTKVTTGFYPWASIVSRFYQRFASTYQHSSRFIR